MYCLFLEIKIALKFYIFLLNLDFSRFDEIEFQPITARTHFDNKNQRQIKKSKLFKSELVVVESWFLKRKAISEEYRCIKN